jgi:ubiquinone/menaquinone biosynthesis C-methylase UbiE
MHDSSTQGSSRRSLENVRNYIQSIREKTLDDYQPEFEKTIRLLRRVKEFGPGTDILEVGSGSGWFTILSRKHGFNTVGVEISWELVDFARKRAAKAGIDAPFHEAEAESLPLPDASFDVVYANSVMEHVKGWRESLREIHRVLRPGGLVFVGTTNRLYPISTEMDFPLYQWLPLNLQKRVSIWKRGPEIMDNGFAWNHFTPMGLRRALHGIGFRVVQDVFDIVRPDDLKGVKKLAKPLLPILKGWRVSRIPFFCLISTSNIWAIK